MLLPLVAHGFRRVLLVLAFPSGIETIIDTIKTLAIQ